MMKKVVYYVAISIDGFICGLDADISGFVGEGNGVTQYLVDLKEFETVIMGRNTYEFGYAYGLKPGQPAYPHMEHYICSKSMSFDNMHEKVHLVTEYETETINKLKKSSNTDIYLCGGGIFAGWLLEHKLIDVLKVKLNPLLLGDGIRLFGDSKQGYKLNLTDTHSYDGGLVFNTYNILYK
ncbi:dihydrofolate reductase family protein [uncultured Maribacter sp.]|uniref:dihydrofolate reductase family protein n=1 Tax=uncultured Maribacter sp. TaxID=431308 RepID=UPI0030EEDCAF|tara:strand:- start:56387 stop:56929 length:543 start_codon:yes stop_codon:yes gene_type:complete